MIHTQKMNQIHCISLLFYDKIVEKKTIVKIIAYYIGCITVSSTPVGWPRV